MRGSRPLSAAAGASAASILFCLPGAAQVVPGLRAPESAAEAILQAHQPVCVLAAAGRPVPGLNMDLTGEEGMTALDAVPAQLSAFVPSAPAQRVVQLKVPGEPVWIVHDAASGRCAIYSFTDADQAEAKLLEAFAKTDAWKRRKAKGDVDHRFEWAIAKPLYLRSEISTPAAPGEPFTVVVTRFTR